MRNSRVNLRLEQLRELIDRTNDATHDINLQGHWGRYLCMMTAAFIENSLQDIYADFAEKASSPQIAQFVSNRLARIYNPNSRRFLEVAGYFSKQWRQELTIFFEDDSHRAQSAIDSIMSLRNSIAHGGRQPASISPIRIRGYLDQSVGVLEFIESQCMG